MPIIVASTSVPFKVLYLPFYRSVSEKLEMGRNCKKGFVKNLSYKIFKRNAHMPSCKWLLIMTG